MDALVEMRVPGTQGVSVKIEGRAVGQFIVHCHSRRVDFDCDTIPVWSVTQSTSGLRFPWIFVTEEASRAFAAEVEGLVDWSRIETRFDSGRESAAQWVKAPTKGDYPGLDITGEHRHSNALQTPKAEMAKGQRQNERRSRNSRARKGLGWIPISLVLAALGGASAYGLSGLAPTNTSNSAPPGGGSSSDADHIPAPAGGTPRARAISAGSASSNAAIISSFVPEIQTPNAITPNVCCDMLLSKMRSTARRVDSMNWSAKTAASPSSEYDFIRTVFPANAESFAASEATSHSLNLRGAIDFSSAKLADFSSSAPFLSSSDSLFNLANSPLCKITTDEVVATTANAASAANNSDKIISTSQVCKSNPSTRLAFLGMVVLSVCAACGVATIGLMAWVTLRLREFRRC